MRNLNTLKSIKILSSNWVITLSATLIGVFLALYLNERMASKTIRDQKKIATEKILSEINLNNENVKISLVKHLEFLTWIEFSTKYMNQEKLIVPQDSMTKFRTLNPNIITITDSTLINKDLYHYKGITNVDFQISNLNLTTIAWKTLKNSGINSTYDFECLMYLEYIEKIIDELVRQDEEFLTYLYSAKEVEISNEKVIQYLQILISYEEGLIETYNQHKNELKNCD